MTSAAEEERTHSAAAQMLQTLHHGWVDLAQHASEPNPFFHPALLIPALDHLAPAKTVQVLQATCDGQLIGLMPIAQNTHHVRYPVNNIGNWVHDQCFFGAPLLRKGQEHAAWALILEQLDSLPGAAHFLHLKGLDHDGPAAMALRACCIEQKRAITPIATHARALLQSDLDAESYWQANVRSKKRKEIRRLTKRLEENGTVSHSRLRDGGDVAQWTQEFLALECSGWKGAEGTALNSHEHSRAFFTQSLANAHDVGMLDMLRIKLNDAPIAMLVNLHMGRGAFSYKIAFDEKFARFSPGTLIEIDNLHATLADPDLDWMDSCAAPGHPMIDGIWVERRNMVQYRIALKGSGLNALKRRAIFHTTGLAELMMRVVRNEKA